MQIFRSSGSLPDSLGPLKAALANAFKLAEGDATHLTVLLQRPGGQDARRQATKIRHDLKGALRTLGYAVQALKSGYRFDDDKASAKLDAMVRALDTLERESAPLIEALSEA